MLDSRKTVHFEIFLAVEPNLNPVRELDGFGDPARLAAGLPEALKVKLAQLAASAEWAWTETVGSLVFEAGKKQSESQFGG